MALRADTDPHILPGRAGLNDRPASTGNSGLTVFRMYIFFHFKILLRKLLFLIFSAILLFCPSYTDIQQISTIFLPPVDFAERNLHFERHQELGVGLGLLQLGNQQFHPFNRIHRA